MAGTGSHAAWLAQRARAARVRRAVTMLGHVDDAALVDLLARASAVVLPSRYEPFGIVALEAAAVGAPLVASRAGGLGEVVLDGVTGLSFDPGDVAGCAAAVIAALDDPDAAERRAVDRAGAAGHRLRLARDRRRHRRALRPHTSVGTRDPTRADPRSRRATCSGAAEVSVPRDDGQIRPR